MEVYIEDYYGIHKGYNLHLNPGYTCLVGPNGAGKTTLLTQLEKKFDDEAFTVLAFDNYTMGGREVFGQMLSSNETKKAASAFLSSEGQRILMAMGEFMQRIGNAVRNTDGKTLFILLDAVDSGLSIDGVLELRDVFNLILNDVGGENVYIVASANSFELAKDADCVDVRTGKHLKFSDYSIYRKYILEYGDAHDHT